MKQNSMHEFASHLTFADLPVSVISVLKRSTLDTLGVAAIGTQSELSGIVRRVAPVLFGTTENSAARMLMDGCPVSATGAAMAGAFTIDSIDAHDGTTPCKGHAGSAVFPALLAMADAANRDMTGAEFMTHLAVAYEVSYRAGLAQHAKCADYHTSGAWTAVGVAAACARMLGGTPSQIRHAAGIGEYHGPRSQMMRCIDHPTMLRDGVGWGAPSGVTAAYLALSGFTGAPALTCEQSPEHWSDLGKGWRIADHTHYKAYPCCRWAHPAIDAVKHLMQTHGLKHQDIAAIRIRTFHNATRLAGHEPKNLDEFAYSIAFPVALMAVRGCIGVKELAPETLQDKQVLRVSRLTELIDDPDITAKSIAKRYAQVEIQVTDGSVYSDALRSTRGDADDPLSDREIESKFHLFAEPILGAARTAEIKALCNDLPDLNVEKFKRLLDLSLSAC